MNSNIIEGVLHFRNIQLCFLELVNNFDDIVQNYKESRGGYKVRLLKDIYFSIIDLLYFSYDIVCYCCMYFTSTKIETQQFIFHTMKSWIL